RFFPLAVGAGPVARPGLPAGGAPRGGGDAFRGPFPHGRGLRAHRARPPRPGRRLPPRRGSPPLRPPASPPLALLRRLPRSHRDIRVRLRRARGPVQRTVQPFHTRQFLRKRPAGAAPQTRFRAREVARFLHGGSSSRSRRRWPCRARRPADLRGVPAEANACPSSESSAVPSSTTPW